MSGSTAGVVLSICCGLLVSFISANQNGPFHHRGESVQQQLAILHGGDLIYDGVAASYPQARNRILFPTVMTVIAMAVPGLTSGEAYLLARVGFGVLMCLSAYFACAFVTGSARLGLVGLSLYTYLVLFTFGHPWEHPWDFADACFMFVMVYLSTSAPLTIQRRLAITAVVLLAATNRESAAFAGIVWFFVHAVPLKTERIVWTEVLFAAALAIAGYGFALLIRGLFSPEEVFGQIVEHGFSRHIAEQWTTLRSALLSPHPFSWLALAVCAHLPPVLTLIQLRAWRKPLVARLLLADLAILAVTLLWGNIQELRVLLPHFALLTFACILALSDSPWASPPEGAPGFSL